MPPRIGWPRHQTAPVPKKKAARPQLRIQQRRRLFLMPLGKAAGVGVNLSSQGPPQQQPREWPFPAAFPAFCLLLAQCMQMLLACCSRTCPGCCVHPSNGPHGPGVCTAPFPRAPKAGVEGGGKERIVGCGLAPAAGAGCIPPPHPTKTVTWRRAGRTPRSSGGGPCPPVQTSWAWRRPQTLELKARTFPVRSYLAISAGRAR